MNAPQSPPLVAPSSKARALAYISDYLLRTGHSPSIGDIAGALGVGRTRAKALVHQLATDKMITRLPGSQRAISVPGLSQQAAIEQLSALGWSIDAKARTAAAPCPQEHLSLVAILDHIPVDSGDGGDDDFERVRSAAGGAPGARAAAAEGGEALRRQA